jgi:hypothetical protein
LVSDADEIGRILEGRRERHRPLRVFVSLSERAQIQAQADACRLSISAYLRTLGTGFTPRSMLDIQAIRELLKVLADQGRLGGLLKLWLVEKPGQGTSTFEVRRVLRQIEDLQTQLKALVRRLG